MTGRLRWWQLWRRAADTSGEARRHLADLTARDAQVAQLGRDLRDRQRRNHFSEMVRSAISRAAEGGS